ncbi:MAG: hypothetical protein LLG42_12405 [Chloroflexi bacterium]|nr:hypothetical protein [Chloroflexota bacterium]
MNNALSWLNRFESTHLRRTTQAILRHINDPEIDETKRQQMIETVVEQSRENSDRFEVPELMLHLAGFHFARLEASTAMEYARQARLALAEGSHACAVSDWILGIIAWKTGDTWLAFSSWYQARQTFEQLAEAQERAEKNVNAQWYRDLLIRINMEMICKTEEVYTWLDIFDPSRLSGKALSLVDAITDQLNQEWLTESDKQSIAGLVNDLHNLGLNSLDPLESAEVLVECAMIVFRLGDITQAQDMLRKAVEIFPPQSHQRTVTLWLLGILEWQLPDSRSSAITHWEECLEMMEDLIQIYQQDEKPERVAWYRQKRGFMSRVLEKKIAAAAAVGKG